MVQALQTIADNIQAASQTGWVEYVSIGISLISVVFSWLAIRTAARVPKKIAEQENKIALFERRLVCYNEIRKHIDFCVLSKDTVDVTEIKNQFECVFCIENDAKLDRKYLIEIMTHMKGYLYQMPFLFPYIQQQDINKVYFHFLKLTESLHLDYPENEIIQRLNVYVETIEWFEERYNWLMKKYLKIAQ